MPDYNLGRAHGTIRIDYDGSGADAAKRDMDDLGKEAGETSNKIDSANREVGRSYRRLQQETRSINITPDLDRNAFAQLVQSLREVQNSTRVSSSILNTFSGRLRLLVAVSTLASPAIAGIGVSLARLAGLAGLAAGALAGLASVGGTLATGLSGIGEAFKAAEQAADAATTGAAANAKAQRAAARAIEDAKRSLIRAEEDLRRTQEDAARAVADALEQVEDAQRDLQTAQRDAIRAQEQLNRARQQAVRDLEDLRFALTGGALDERQAILDVKEAQEELNKVLADPTATANDIEQATLNLEKQQLALEQTRKENERLKTDAAAAAAAGVEGSERVVSAQDSVRDATLNVAEAQEALQDAQDNVRRVQIESARQIADAVQAVVDAQRNLQEAYEDSADTGSAAAAKLDSAMADLSPNARAFVQEVLSLKGAWDSLSNSVQDELFADLAGQVRPLANTWFPLLSEGMGRVARGLNDIIEETIRYLQTSEAQENVANIFDQTSEAVNSLKNFVSDLLAAFLDIASVGSTFLPQLADGAADAALRFRNFVDAAKESGELREWIQDSIEAASELWQLIKNLGSIIGSVFTGLDQAGGGALGVLTDLTGKLAEFLETAEAQEALGALGSILTSIGGAYGKVFLAFLKVAADILVALEPFITAFADAVGVYLVGALTAIAPVLQAFADIIGFLGPALGPVIAGIYAANKAVGAAKVAWGLLNGVMKANPFLQIAVIIITLVTLIIQNWDSIVQFLSGVWQGIQDLAVTIWTAISDFFKQKWQEIKDTTSEIWNGITGFLSQKWNEIKTGAIGVWNGIVGFFKGIWESIKNGVGGFVKDFLNYFRDLPGKVMDFIKSLPGRLANWGQDLISGVVKGLGNFAHKIWQKLKQIVSDAWDNVLDFFGIRSPSRLAAEAGENIVAGLIRGLDSSTNAAVQAAAEMAKAVGNELTGAGGSLAASVNFSANTAGIPSEFAATGAVSQLGLSTAPARGEGARSVVVQIDNLTIPISGNLDPTNPTAFRQAIMRLKTQLRNLDREYV